MCFSCNASAVFGDGAFVFLVGGGQARGLVEGLARGAVWREVSEATEVDVWGMAGSIIWGMHRAGLQNGGEVEPIPVPLLIYGAKKLRA